MQEAELELLIKKVLSNMDINNISKNSASNDNRKSSNASFVDDSSLEDLGDMDFRKEMRVPNPQNLDMYMKLKQATPGRIGIWRSGPRYTTRTMLRFRADHATAQDTVFKDVPEEFVKENPKYIMKITGDDALGKAELDNFIDLDSRYPVIAVTSRLMSTGVDAKTCKLIVLDRTVGSMTEFKQIIGRGTRVNEEYGKYYFTIMDFRNATKQFANPEFDGYPTEVKLELGANVDEQDADEGDIDDIEFEEGIEDTYDWDEAEPIKEHKVKKYYVDDVEVEVVDVNVQYLDENGKLIAENIKSFCRNFMLKRFPKEKDFIDIWQSASNKTKLLTGLSDTGLFLDELRREYGREYDVYDVILQNTYGTEPLTREQRAQKANKIIEQLEGDCKNIFADVMAKYVEVGISALENRNTLRIEPFTSQYGTGVEIVRKIGGNEKYINITDKLKNAIYEG